MSHDKQRRPRKPPTRRSSALKNRGTGGKAAAPARPSGATGIEQAHQSRDDLAPLQRLKAIVAGKIDLTPDTLQRVLLDQLADEHGRLKELDAHSGTLLELLVTPPPKGEKPPDALATLKLISKLEATRERRSRGLVRLTELLHKVSTGPRPRLQVVATAAQVNVRGE